MIQINKQVSYKSILLLIIFSCLMIPIMAQVDTASTVKPDSTTIAKTDTIQPVPADTTAQTKEKKKFRQKEAKAAKEEKR